MDFTKPQAATTPPPAPSAPFKPANSRFYKPDVAAGMFRSAGREERFGAGEVIFMEDEKASKGGLFSRGSATRMHYLAEGDVGLTIAGRPLDLVKAGEVFGEMAVISGRPRSATATARADCVTYSLDAGELQSAIGKNPEFALMLASVMYDRLRFIAARLAARPRPGGNSTPLSATVFEPSMVAQLQDALPRSAVVRYGQETLIFKEGQVGTFMYVVVRGRVGIAVGSSLVEIAGPGATFGEMAVVDQSPRTARAGSIEEVELLAIDRKALLELIRGNPVFAMTLLRSVADRLRHMNEQMK